MRVGIAGNQAVSRRALAILLYTRLGIETVGEAREEKELMELVKSNHPELILLEDGLPGAQLGVLVPALHNLEFNPAVLVLSERKETEQVALAAGADRFVRKGDHPKQLLTAITSVLITGNHE